MSYATQFEWKPWFNGPPFGYEGLRGRYETTDRTATAVASISPFLVLTSSQSTLSEVTSFEWVAVLGECNASAVDRHLLAAANASRRPRVGPVLTAELAGFQGRPAKNQAAIALLRSWLADSHDDAEQADSLAATIESLNLIRQSERKLFR